MIIKVGTSKVSLELGERVVRTPWPLEASERGEMVMSRRVVSLRVAQAGRVDSGRDGNGIFGYSEVMTGS